MLVSLQLEWFMFLRRFKLFVEVYLLDVDDGFCLEVSGNFFLICGFECGFILGSIQGNFDEVKYFGNGVFQVM